VSLENNPHVFSRTAVTFGGKFYMRGYWHVEGDRKSVSVVNSRPPLWSSGQSSWLQIRKPGFDSQHYQSFWGGGKVNSSGSGTGSTQPREYN
jgi:hypothetical protein